MKRAALLAATLLLPLMATVSARADDGDSAALARAAAFIGDQAVLTLQVSTPRGATVEVDPAAASWSGVEVVRVDSAVTRDEAGRTVHTLKVIVAAFVTGDLQFSPAVNVVADSVVTPRKLPAVSLRVASTLGANDPLELTPLAPPGGIEGAESPLLRPAIVAGVVLASVALIAGVTWLTRRLTGWLRRPRFVSGPEAPTADLSSAEQLLHTDPVGAYRRLAGAVRLVLADRYGFPAAALTTRELGRRMESEGVDRWQARLVTGLLEECDAVVYAGYRPAVERRQADLVAAREIVEAAS